jgi:hypothetical protein
MKKPLDGLIGTLPSYTTLCVRISFGYEVGTGSIYYHQQSVRDAVRRQTEVFSKIRNLATLHGMKGVLSSILSGGRIS